MVITVFKAPHSYTGEDMIEISCHGGQAVRQEILRVLYSLGIRPAAPGEFTKTAFINGKMDLTEAEAVMNVISADSSRALDASNTQLMGKLKTRITEAEDRLYDALSAIEMMIEFPEHDDTPENTKRIEDLICGVKKSFESLERSFGRPSASRSSMLRDRKTVLDTEVHVGSHMDGRRVADFGLPLGTLIVSVTRGGAEIIPDGNTILRGGDVLEILTR